MDEKEEFMTGAEMLTIILSILIPTLSGLGWVIVKIFGMKKEISGIRREMLEMKIELFKGEHTYGSPGFFILKDT
jgi:hypothetical protein